MAQDVLDNLELKMDDTITRLKNELSKLRTGRANPSILDGLVAEYYGALTPLVQLAVISVPEARMMVIKPFDKSSIDAIERAINTANLGLSPNNDGEIIRLNFPALTEETRKELVKDVKKIGEEFKVNLRNQRRDANDELKKLDLTEDDEKGYLEDVQKLTDGFVKKVEAICKDKETDLMSV